MALALRYAARSDIGLGRYVNNQDSGYAGPHLLAVCDGMGGHAAGDIASSLALGRLVALDGEGHGTEAPTLLEQAIAAANDDLRQRVLTEPTLHGMGTTTTALILHGDRIGLAHIGDSRCYLLRQGKLIPLTRDHTFVQSLVDDGKITIEEAERHPQRSVITRVLTGDPHDTADLSVRETEVGDRYLLCSDGLTGVVSEATLAEALTDIDDPGNCAETLVSYALRGGGADNITCIVAYVVDATLAEADSVPEVVGSAAVHGTISLPAATDSPAAKAAALDRSLPEAAADVTPDEPARNHRRWLRAVVGLVTLGLTVGIGYGLYSWSQRQYFIGADGDQVAIYQGLPQDIGPLKLSHPLERNLIPLADLPQFSADQIRATITTDGLLAARAKIAVLQAQTCDSAPIGAAAAAGCSNR
jgi:PPM family protein phosphatase